MNSLFDTKKRSFIVGFLFLFGFLVILARLSWIQIIQAEEILSNVPKDWIVDSTLKAKRGSIYDRKNNLLATEITKYYLIADSSRIKNPEKISLLLSPILHIKYETLLELLKQKKKSIEIRDEGNNTFTEDMKNSLSELVKRGELEGIFAYPVKQRYYPTDLATHILGFLNRDNIPVGGIEKYYNNILSGQDGSIKYNKAKNGIMIEDKPNKFKAPIEGKDLTLSIDISLQKSIENQLDSTIKHSGAKGGTVIVADPKTGEILSLVSRPSFNISKYAKEYTAEKARNMAVESQFEPGSTFKIITLSAAIEENIFKPDETFASGSIKVSDRVIHDWKKEGWGNITYRKGIEQSSNVAFVNLGNKLGSDRLVNYIDRFGFGDITAGLGKTTGIDLPNEGRGYFFNSSLKPVELATVAFGQGISVTPIQQLSAVSAIANDGVWIQPHLLREINDIKNNKKASPSNFLTKRIVTEKTAKEVRELLRGVVTQGTGEQSNLAGYDLAGKTGTAQKPKVNGSGYMENKYIMSFIGFAPYKKPQVVFYIALDEPASDSSSNTVAPLAKEVLRLSVKQDSLQK